MCVFALSFSSARVVTIRLLVDWLDNSRDITNFLLHYLPENVKESALPMRLERLPASMAKARKEHGYPTRKLVVVGHSFGGCTS